ncbi:TPA: LOW QUALITY PROTEIN: hypothetical protein N0F65_007214 [Lagenidium giganteum]|uniref:Uncharacterized protein n=1 Tax=Lagenidium giganteum TaxID=4803 RepID=A0AAV2Z986_9STRA|nr:TPA: LOW QUALITY PROTEIN: hypothetical protein N0F65_007214 [Lagenidium giganteum]
MPRTSLVILIGSPSCVDTSSPKSTTLPQFQHVLHKPSPHGRNAVTSHKSRPRNQQEHASTDDIHQVAVPNSFSLPIASIRTPVKDHHTADPDIPGKGLLTGSRSPSASTARSRQRTPSKRTQMEADRLEAIEHENLRLQQRIQKISTSHKHHVTQSPDGSIYEMSSILNNKRVLHDYNKKQEQVKIWTENQALLKRLRSAKSTLKSKEWEKDDKWNRHYLKAQEKRRHALQNEMQREMQKVVEASPQSAVQKQRAVEQSSAGKRSRKAGGPTVLDALGDDEHVPSSAPQSAATRRVRHAAALEKRSSSDRAVGSDAIPLTAAANHRRIMLLRKQKKSTTVVTGDESARTDGSGDCDGGMQSTRAQDGTSGSEVEQDDDTEKHSKWLADTDVVSVRFTFSRQGARGESAETATDKLRIIDSLALRMDRSEAAPFSPAVEIEGVLESMFELDRPGQPPPAEPSYLALPDVDDEIVNSAVFEALQACIDEVARLEEEEPEEVLGDQHEVDNGQSGMRILTEHATNETLLGTADEPSRHGDECGDVEQVITLVADGVVDEAVTDTTIDVAGVEEPRDVATSQAPPEKGADEPSSTRSAVANDSSFDDPDNPDEASIAPVVVAVLPVETEGEIHADDHAYDEAFDDDEHQDEFEPEGEEQEPEQNASHDKLDDVADMVDAVAIDEASAYGSEFDDDAEYSAAMMDAASPSKGESHLDHHHPVLAPMAQEPTEYDDDAYDDAYDEEE